MTERKVTFRAPVYKPPPKPIYTQSELDAALAQARADCLMIARGCFDYGGGYRSNDEKLEIYHHGIQTVVNALASFIEKGLEDTQVASLYRVGLAAAAKEGK